MNDLKLFVWTQFCPDYNGGLAFAIAKDETEARSMIEKDMEHSIWDWGNLEILPIEPVSRSVVGGS